MMGYVVVFSTAAVLLQLSSSASYIIDNDISNFAGDNSLTSLMERLTAMDQRFNAVDQRFTALDQRVSSLSQRLDQLQDRVSGKQQTPNGHGTNAQMSTTTPTPETTTPILGSEFYITRVSKEDVGDSYKVRVEYAASSKPSLVTLRLNYRDLPMTLGSENLGVVEALVPKSAVQHGEEYFGHTMIHFTYPSVYVTAYLRLDANASDSMKVPRVAAHAAHGSDVIYEPGSDAELDFKVKVEGAPESLEDEYYHSQVFLKSSTEENRVNSYFANFRRPGDSPVWLDLVKERRGKKGDREGTIRINTTLDDPRGLLEIGVELSFNCSHDCLLPRLGMSALLAFHSSDHSGPYPEAFIGFIRNEYEDPTRQFCDLRYSAGCNIHCRVLGNAPSTAEIGKVLPNGDVIPTDDVTMSFGRWTDSQLKIANVTQSDAGTYRCTARSGPKEVSMDVSLSVGRSAKINTNESEVTRFDDGTVAATCIAEGNPAPNVTFDTSYYPMSDADPEDYNVTMTQLDESTTMAEIVITNVDLVSRLYFFDCSATNQGSSQPYENRDTYSLYFQTY